MAIIYIIVEGFYADAIGAFTKKSDAEAYVKLRNSIDRSDDCHEYDMIELDANSETLFAEMRQCEACKAAPTTPSCPEYGSNPAEKCLTNAREKETAMQAAQDAAECEQKKRARNGMVKRGLLRHAEERLVEGLTNVPDTTKS